MRIFGTLAVVALFAAPAFGQPSHSPQPTETQPSGAKDSAPTKFEAADVHFTPPTLAAERLFYRNPFLRGDRYILRQATLLDLIATAYSLKQTDYVGGGPSWIEWDRYDIEAKVPSGTTHERARLMLQNLLAERFHLVVHPGEVPTPAYFLTVANRKPNLKPSDPTEGSCKFKPSANPESGTAPLNTLECRGLTTDSLANTLRNVAGIYLQAGVPVIDATGLKGGYDFDLKWTPHDLQGLGGLPGISLFAALEEQLGLKLETKAVPRPGLVVDSVNEEPTSNSPDMAKIMPPLPPPQLEVATIRPSPPDEPNRTRVTADELDYEAVTLKWIIMLAWDLNQNKDFILVAPKWIGDERIDIHAKIPAGGLGTYAAAGAIVWDNLFLMLRSLLADRFQMKYHVEDRPVDSYALVAVDPKLTRADPSERTGCKVALGPDPKDSRLKNPTVGGPVRCSNVTMGQFAEQLHRMAPGYFKFPAKDATGLKGGWDFTIGWSGATYFANGTGPSPAQTTTSDNAPATADPNGAVSLYDALRKQLGLKVVKERLPEPFFVIDQINREPTEN